MYVHFFGMTGFRSSFLDLLYWLKRSFCLDVCSRSEICLALKLPVTFGISDCCICAYERLSCLCATLEAAEGIFAVEQE
jgi:hypothetical protein